MQVKENFANKIIIDTTNSIAETPPTNGVLTLSTTADSSLMEYLQKLLPDAKFVKCFSCVGNLLMCFFGGLRSRYVSHFNKCFREIKVK